MEWLCLRRKRLPGRNGGKDGGNGGGKYEDGDGESDERKHSGQSRKPKKERRVRRKEETRDRSEGVGGMPHTGNTEPRWGEGGMLGARRVYGGGAGAGRRFSNPRRCDEAQEREWAERCFGAPVR